jgi:hypothetical protein
MRRCPASIPSRVYQSKRSCSSARTTVGLAGRDEELHLHLLELERAEDEVAGVISLRKRLADLRDAERRLRRGELRARS